MTNSVLTTYLRRTAVRLFAVSSIVVTGCAGEDGEEYDATEEAPAEETPDALGFKAPAGETLPATADAELESLPTISASDQKGRIKTCLNGTCEIFRWEKGMGEVSMRPTSTHFCTLSKVSGNFAGWSGVNVYHDRDRFSVNPFLNAFGQDFEERDKWLVSGLMLESGTLSAEAVCVPKSKFRTKSGGVIWDSGTREACAIAGTFSSTTASTALWKGDAASMLTGIGGPLEDGMFKGYIVQGATADDKAQLRYRTDNQNWRGCSEGQSLFVGVPHTGDVRREMVFLQNGRVTQEVSLVVKDGQRSFPLMGTDHGFCYLTYVGGGFAGSGEEVGLTVNTNQWMLNAKSAGGHTVYVNARCMYFDQSKNDTVIAPF